MKIDKVELIGFKSFAERTVFNFHQGITCIVGPNGCGKSNIVDAFKWVLGEQSAKSLRGDKMEEVIFGGSQSKKPKGMSEVTLHISNLESFSTGAGVGNESKLTTITRRLYRSGDSEYMINKNVCRLKDIKDLFLDTGLEVKSYSILEQDRISAILNAKPEDRRFLIEEIAGVVKYKVRRTEAMSKLESSRLNLQRINDIVAEVKRQINSLDRQVKKAERYKRLMGEIKEIELRLAKMEYVSFLKSLNEIIAHHDAFKETDAGKRAELAKAESELEARRLLLLDREKNIELRQAELTELERNIADITKTIAVLKAEKENLVQRTGRLHQEEEDVRRKIAETLQRGKDIESLKSNISIEMDSLKESLRAENESLTQKEGEFEELSQTLESRRKEAFSVSEDLSRLRNELNNQKAFIENLEKKSLRLNEEISETGETLRVLGDAMRDTVNSIVSKKNETASLNEEFESVSSDITHLKEKSEGQRTNLGLSREDLASSLSRLESLREMVTGGEPFGEIEHITTIAEIIDVPGEYEKAVEGALREAINGLILKDLDSADSVANTLREKDLEKTALIPLGIDRNTPDYEIPSGIIGRALDFISIKDDYFQIIKNLLRNVLIVKDIKAAFEINNPDFQYVTLEGEVIEPSGAIIAGRGKGILKRKRQIRELETDIEDKKAGINKIQSELDSAISLLKEKEDKMTSLSSMIISLEKELQGLAHNSEKFKEDIERTERKLSMLWVEMDEALKEKESVLGHCALKESAIISAEEIKKQVETSISEVQEGIASKRARYEEQRTTTVDIKLSLNSYRERLESLDKELDGLGALGKEFEDKTKYILQEIINTSEKITEKDTRIIFEDESLRGIVTTANEIKNKIAEEKGSISGELEELKEIERGIKDLRMQIDEMSQRISSLEVSRAEHKLRIENLTTNIKNTYDIALEAFEAEPPAPEDEERLATLKAKVQELGPVSLGTIEEYEELKTRHEFLTNQQKDIEQSIAELEEAISKINSTTKKRLREAYDALTVKFAEIFSLLFGGGKAELMLTDENNILETGIDIAVQPPGKKLQNITLLSGGEKSLTALALLFASFLIKPTPLCILDEADAALDESNAERFTGMLGNLSKDTQFVVVTHNRVTMSAADYIYGITMEEPGTSKVLSMELVEAT